MVLFFFGDDEGRVCLVVMAMVVICIGTIIYIHLLFYFLYVY
jgi:hypothetical protein